VTTSLSHTSPRSLFPPVFLLPFVAFDFVSHPTSFYAHPPAHLVHTHAHTLMHRLRMDHNF
jgi:hypothetical protein